MTDPRRALPSVDRLLQSERMAPLLARLPRTLVLDAVREVLAEARASAAPLAADWAERVAARADRRDAPSLVPVLNATGVVLHTNLGRAPLAPAAVAALGAAAGYTPLEYDREQGTRGSRSEHGRRLLAELAGAEDALVVNNAAGALVLALAAHATGGEVLLSRGELIEIGGSFRIPDILAQSGARLREVGTTNRTHPDDYRRALGPGVRAILTVHRSNFEQRGFVATPGPAELAGIAAEAGIPYLHDVGSGLLLDLSPWGLTGEPLVRDAAAAADLVIFSGDKLLGGPQAGCVVGRAAAVARCRSHPLARALRADKLTLAALTATLALYRDPAAARREIPVLAMLTCPPDELARRAGALAERCGPARAELRPGESAVGGGSFPGATLPTTLVAIDPSPLGAEELARRLRRGDPPVVVRVADDRVLLDPRTLPGDMLDRVAAALDAALAETA